MASAEPRNSCAGYLDPTKSTGWDGAALSDADAGFAGASCVTGRVQTCFACACALLWACHRLQQNSNAINLDI